MTDVVEKKEVEVAKEESDDEVPALEAADTAEQGEEVPMMGRATRSEKKSRKAMAKLGLKPVSGCLKVSINKSKSIVFVISKPDVYKNATGSTYVIFGEARMEHLNAEKEREAMKAFAAAAKAGMDDKKDDEQDDEEEGEVDATGVSEKDIELVMNQANVKRGKAVAALKKANNDVVNAIMECQ
eukprot:TRINITY_DN47075_c0_g1_i1.p1 TRINITY_DN47075_c0_g1~~TRINITY_DN47075_c0_g1_i1.p1  ORF type:complete len:184 (+),score=102.21 TRINITY_DN47075_c0_g1_i1:49-600(+)